MNIDQIISTTPDPVARDHIRRQYQSDLQVFGERKALEFARFVVGNAAGDLLYVHFFLRGYLRVTKDFTHSSSSQISIFQPLPNCARAFLTAAVNDAAAPPAQYAP